jgi:hypothetical protein
VLHGIEEKILLAEKAHVASCELTTSLAPANPLPEEAPALAASGADDP